MAKTTKALKYFRCIDREQQAFDLEYLVRQAREQLDTVASSEIEFADEVIRIQHYENHEQGISIHFVRYVPGESNETLTPNFEHPEDNESPHSAPQGMEYKDGDFYMYCSSHNIIGCAHGMNMSHSKIERYLHAFARRGSIDDENPEGRDCFFNISTALNLDKYRLIERHGVKSISFNASAYNASFEQANDNSYIQYAKRKLAEALRDRFEQYEDQHQLNVMQGLIIEGCLRLDGNRRAHETAQGEIRRIAQECAEENNVTIHTQDGEPINSSDMRLQKKIRIDKHGKSLLYGDVWRQLRVYYSELEEQNLLGQ
ncbi:hypothetical protein [Larsenimonas suaedae]|uniref:Uncharacterized protein n=1 Tax=Larsenimonas suaedae TaxID=1851019 RepID=A0ABU1GZ56_9GAMM|nr:hypothetical protein [Larsenimonas suaedae]MCM2973479.1 hypothetical protein [Larsenimonas suaedae]MDR5897345.1 hypothetical protein [Larsenimonas suaedae]